MTPLPPDFRSKMIQIRRLKKSFGEHKVLDGFV